MKTPAFIVIEEVCRNHGITRDELRARTKRRPIVHARQHAAYRLRRETGLSLLGIGARLAISASDVVYSVNQWQRRLVGAQS